MGWCVLWARKYGNHGNCMYGLAFAIYIPGYTITKLICFVLVYF